MPTYFWVYAFDVVKGIPQDVRGGDLSGDLQAIPLKNPPVVPISQMSEPPSQGFIKVHGIAAKDQNVSSIHFINSVAFSAPDAGQAALLRDTPPNHQALFCACKNCVLYEVL